MSDVPALQTDRKAPAESVVQMYEPRSEEEDGRQEVDVASGIQEYRDTEAALRRTLSGHTVRTTKSQKSNKSLPPVAEDLEMQAANVNSDETRFDLKDVLENHVRATKENGITGKHMGLVVKNLTVVGEGADASSIENMASTLVLLAKALNPLSWFRKASRGTDFDILHEINGFVKDGEMLLVLGRPGSGCSTFLRVAANERKSYKEINGVVTYGGVPAQEFDQYKGEAIYVGEEDVHFPTLTVKQLLHFALKTKTPGTRLPAQTQRDFRQSLVHMLTNMFGLTNQVNTLVGNEFVRGLSGGERKRATLAEAMTARAAINAYDGGTRGLDAASALDYTRSLRIMCDTVDKTIIASFYQASEDMYDLFDKVMVLDKGKMIFFGPQHRAKQYFVEMGYDCEARKSTPDFLTGVTNPQERIYRKGFEPSSVPSNPAEMEMYFKNSEDFKLLKAQMAEYEAEVERQQPHKEFVQTIRQAKTRGTRSKTVYTVNFYEQTKALIAREFQLMLGDPQALFGRVLLTIIKAFIYATIYIKLPLNANGAFVRGAALFSSLMFLSLMSLSELPNAMRGRRILAKHKSYAMYYPSAYHLASVVADIPNTLVQVTAFSICAYFLEGLRLSAGAFFIFVVTVFVTGLCMTEVFRLCGSVCKSYFAASQAANIILIASLAYNGFLIHVDKMHPWLKWIYYINPLSYGFKALILNEMNGLTFPCTSTEAVPYGGAYEDASNTPYRVCTTPGQVNGDLSFEGLAYVEAVMGFHYSQLAMSIIAIVLFWFLFILLNCAAMEGIHLVEGGYTRQVYLKGKAPKQNDATTDGPAAPATPTPPAYVAEGDANAEAAFATDTSFTWQDVNYTVPVKGGSRQLLTSVEGWIKPGEMTALMGSSGAGKTTLLDVLAKRKTIGTIDGKVFLNGEAIAIDFERITGYVEQMDVHNPMQTVREALRFSAAMRQDAHLSMDEKYAYVEKVLDMMEMTELGDALIGDLDSGRGISIEQRKRLTIGMELVGKPKILFLDEPTSGLDSQSSYNIIKFLRKLADNGMPLVCTIHQPSSILFEYFDRLLLLARGGKTVYFGDIGENSRTLLGYFEKNGARKCRESENPAEYILQAIGAGTSAAKSNVDWAETWKHSQEKVAITSELDHIAHGTEGKVVEHTHRREFATGTMTQLIAVSKRMHRTYWRDITYNYGRFLNALFVGLFNGFTFFKIGNSSSDLTTRIFFAFFLLFLGNSMITLVQPQFMAQRAYFRREYASKFYSYPAFIFAIVTTEIPYIIATTVICFCASFWTAGLETTPARNIFFFLMFCLYMIYAVSLGQAVASACSNIVQASILNPFLFSFLVLFCGVLIPPQAMVHFWKSWLYPLDPYHYLLEGLVVNVLHDVPVVCTAEDLLRFAAPAGQTCGAYLTTFFTYAPGYLTNPDETGTCNYCPFANGNEYIETFSWDFGHRWRNFGIFSCYWAFNIGVCVFLTYLFRKPKR
ncbi:hypothetical protein HKX48_005943 [Thoreauomyces humboldtii]|nr:hypothetical protein HKX48_005943 [Thoreauomyces humboldtii]